MPGVECICDLIWEKSKRIIVGGDQTENIWISSCLDSYVAECVYI